MHVEPSTALTLPCSAVLAPTSRGLSLVGQQVRSLFIELLNRCCCRHNNTCVCGQVPTSFVPQPNPDEVQAVFSMPLSCFLDSHRHLHWDVRSKNKP